MWAEDSEQEAVMLGQTHQEAAIIDIAVGIN